MTKSRLYLLLITGCLAGYVWVYINYSHPATHSACIIKNATNIPCPSCGSTRSVISVLHGDINGAIIFNPLGVLLTAILAILPVWLSADLILKKQSFFLFYMKFEQTMRMKFFAIPAATLIIINWVWNIYKGL